MKQVPIKAWVGTEAKRLGVGNSAIWGAIHRGKYPGLHMHRRNARVVFVEVPDEWQSAVPISTRGHTCLCGREGTHRDHGCRSWVCDRCAEIESRMNDYHDIERTNSEH